MANYAFYFKANSYVGNIIDWDGKSAYDPGDDFGLLEIKEGDVCIIGVTKVIDGKFVNPQE